MPGAYQTVKGAGRDAASVLLKADFSEVLYGTFVGGASTEDGRSGSLDEQPNVCMVGQTDGAGWPAVNACQGAFAGGGYRQHRHPVRNPRIGGAGGSDRGPNGAAAPARRQEKAPVDTCVKNFLSDSISV